MFPSPTGPFFGKLSLARHADGAASDQQFDLLTG